MAIQKRKRETEVDERLNVLRQESSKYFIDSICVEEIVLLGKQIRKRGKNQAKLEML